MTTPGSLASRDPHQLSIVNISTYQLISTQDASAELEAAAIEDWRDQLGVRTVVLDKCHHLLDHWALVTRALLDRLGPGVGVIGLTATLPDPEDPVSYEHYTALLGDVDFEVPTPAVVREGDRRVATCIVGV